MESAYLVRTGPSGQIGRYRDVPVINGQLIISRKRVMAGTYAVVYGNKVVGWFTRSNEFFTDQNPVKIQLNQT